MFENLSEQAKTYVTYGATAITGAAVGALILLAGLGINNRLHPRSLTQKELSVNMLNNGTAPKIAELRAELTPLENEEAPLIQAVRRNNGNPDALPDANAPVPPDQNPALTAAIDSLRNFRAQHGARMTELRNQIAAYDRLAAFLSADGNSDVLEYAIRHATRVAPEQALSSSSEGN